MKMGDYEQDPSWELSEEDFSDELEDEFSQEDLINTSQGKKYTKKVLETGSGTLKTISKMW